MDHELRIPSRLARPSGPSRTLGLKTGTVYPILLRLAGRGQVEAVWEPDAPSDALHATSTVSPPKVPRFWSRWIGTRRIDTLDQGSLDRLLETEQQVEMLGSLGHA